VGDHIITARNLLISPLSFQGRIKPIYPSLLLLVCVLMFAGLLYAQNQDVLVRDSDEVAKTVEERQQSVAALLAAAHASESSGDTSKAARFLNRVGRLQLRLNLPEEALATYRNVLKLLDHAPEPSAEVDSLNGSAGVYAHLNQCDHAQPLLKRALSLSKQTGYVAGRAEALLTISDCENHADHVQALKTARESLALWQSEDRKWGAARAQLAIGDYQLEQNDLNEAEKSYKASLQLCQELNIPDGQAEALIALGFVEYRRGAWQDSMTFLAKAQAMLDEKAEPYKMGQVTASIGEAFIESGMPETAIPKLQQAAEYFRITRNPASVIVVSWDIGGAYYSLGRYPESVSTLQGALADAESIKDLPLTAMCHDYLGRTYAAMNERDVALRHFQSALLIFLRVGARMEAARTRALIGQIYQQQGKFEKARDGYHKALETFRTLSDKINQSATLYALGHLALIENDLDAAEKYLQQSIDATEEIRRVSTSRDLTAAFSASVHDRYESYIDCLMRKHQMHLTQGLDQRAFETSELARARSLVELLRATETNAAPGLDSELAERERLVRQSLRVKEDYRVTLLARTTRKEELKALDLETAGLENELQQINEIIKARYPSYNAIIRPGAWTVRQIQEQVIADDQTVLLEYSLGAEKSYVWAITHTGVTSYELPAQAQITEAAQTVYQLLKGEPGADDANGLANALQRLGSMVLSPVAAELNKQRIIVVADGALNYIPFQILPSPSANNEPLVSSYEVVNAPSASILGQLQQEAAHRQTPAHVLAAFGDPIFASNYAQRKDADDGEQTLLAQRQPAVRDIEPSGDSFDPATLEPLFFTKRELANLREVAGAETFVATGFDASREKLESADLSKYAILHFATHGILDPKRPEKSGIVLSMVDRNGQPQDGFVGLQQIYGLRAPVNLVVLSACRTGLGKEVRGEGLIGLTRGFMYAGASSVMASLWKVDDKATAELMKRFYTNMLQRGMTPTAALRSAQNSIRQEPQWRAPYYWAAFTIQGEYRQVIKPAPLKARPPYVLIFAGAVFLLLVGVVWQYRRLRRMRTA
jgi:CHAT domain-containing protein/uncharacterized protein HemY